MLQTAIKTQKVLSEIVDPDFLKRTSLEVDCLAPPAVRVSDLSNQAAAAADADCGLSWMFVGNEQICSLLFAHCPSLTISVSVLL